nr:hypothetical protein CTI12_AA212160 [Tanacetum cinerariifolium]
SEKLAFLLILSRGIGGEVLHVMVMVVAGTNLLKPDKTKDSPHKEPIAPSPVRHYRNGILKEIVTTPRFDSPVTAFDFHSIRDDVIADMGCIWDAMTGLILHTLQGQLVKEIAEIIIDDNKRSQDVAMKNVQNALSHENNKAQSVNEVEHSSETGSKDDEIINESTVSQVS